MKSGRSVLTSSRASALRFAAPLLPFFLACSGSEPAPSTSSGGLPANTGGTASSSGGSTGGSTGGAPSSGGTSPATGGVATGGVSTGGVSTGGSATGGVVNSGGSATGGSSSGGTTTGGVSTGGASTGGSVTGGTAGASTSGGASKGGASSGGASNGGASTGGSAVGGSGGGGGDQPGAALNGASWTMKCTAPHSGNLCYLMPPGQNTCPSAGYTSVDQTLQFGGTPGTTYQVTIHFEGTHEAGDYSGGTALTKEFLKGATHASGGVHTWLSMEVSAPAAIYNPNAGGGAGSVQVYDYRVTIPIEGGATVRMKGSDKDCDMHRYCQNNNTNPCKGYVLEPISPAANPIDGSFLRMTVESVKAM